MPVSSGDRRGLGSFGRKARLFTCKSFKYKILTSNSFGCKILRGRIFSVPLFSRFCKGKGRGGYMAACRIVSTYYLPPRIASGKGSFAHFPGVSQEESLTYK